MVQRKGMLATGLEQVTHHTGCCAFIFWGGCWGPRGKGPSEDAQGSDGHSALRARGFQT